jgi:hypothetical protein
MTSAGRLDEAYEQLHGYGPEFRGWLSNHAPMTADALLRLGHGDAVKPWLHGYVDRLEPAPPARWEILDEDWRDPLGDASRLGDWSALLTRQLHTEPWEAVLARWWPRLLPGAVASAAHGLIRTGHAVRAVREEVTGPRLDELAQALGYWAARWQPLPPAGPGRVARDVDTALDELPALGRGGGIRARLAGLDRHPGWAPAVASMPEPASVPAALDTLIDAAVSHYRRWAHNEPVMLVHAATAPRAVALVLPALPEHLWPAAYDTAWAVTAAIGAAYRPADPAPLDDAPAPVLSEVVAGAVESGDAHAVKFAEVAVESHERGNPTALASAALATALIG